MINLITNLFEELREFIDNYNNSPVVREKQTNIFDAITFRLLYTEKGTTQEKVASVLNTFKDEINRIHRTSFSRRESSVDKEFYAELLNKLVEIEERVFGSKTKVIAVDGTHSHFPSKLTEQGYKQNKNGSITPLILGVHDVTNNFPIAMELTNDKEEKDLYIDFMRNKQKYIEKLGDSVFTFDRNFYCDKILKLLEELDVKYVFRLKKNSKLIDRRRPNRSFFIMDGADVYAVRQVSYVVNGQDYYLLTNLMNKEQWPDYAVASIYNKRWGIEEYFKFLKLHLSLEKLEEKKQNSIIKSLYAHMIITHITSFIEQAYIKVNKEKEEQAEKNIIPAKIKKVNQIKVTKYKYKEQQINKSNLVTGIFRFLIPNLFLKKSDRPEMEEDVRNFLKSYIVTIKVGEDRHFAREAKTPYVKWYFKGAAKKKINNLVKDMDEYDKARLYQVKIKENEIENSSMLPKCAGNYRNINDNIDDFFEITKQVPLDTQRHFGSKPKNITPELTKYTDFETGIHALYKF